MPPAKTCPAADSVRSPSWNRLSSTSVPESIRELAKKYTPGDVPSPASTPAAVAALTPGHQGSDSGNTPQAGGEGRSPTLDPTPHHLLDSIMKRNQLYESPPAGQGHGLTEAAAVQGGVEAPTSSAALLAAEPAAAQPAASGLQSPAAAVAQLLGPVLRLTLEEIEGGKGPARAEEPGGHHNGRARPGGFAALLHQPMLSRQRTCAPTME